MKEPLPVFLHERKEEIGGLRYLAEFRRQLVVSQFVTGESSAGKPVEHAASHLAKYSVRSLKVRRQGDVTPGGGGLAALRLASIQRCEDVVGVTRCRSKSAVFPRGPAIHDGVVQGQVAIPAYLGIEEQEKMNAARAIVDVRFESREYGVDLFPERNAVVVVSLVPLVDDLPHRAGFGCASCTRRVRGQADDLYSVGDRAPQKESRVT